MIQIKRKPHNIDVIVSRRTFLKLPLILSITLILGDTQYLTKVEIGLQKSQAMSKYGVDQYGKGKYSFDDSNQVRNIYLPVVANQGEG